MIIIRILLNIIYFKRMLKYEPVDIKKQSVDKRAPSTIGGNVKGGPTMDVSRSVREGEKKRERGKGS